MESVYFKKCYRVCLHPQPQRLYHWILLLKWSKVFISPSPSITSYGFHSNPKQHKDFRALTLAAKQTCSIPQGFGPSITWGPGQALRSAHLLHTDGLPRKGNKSGREGGREGAATHPSCALICPRQTVTRAHTSSQALRCIPRSRTLEIVRQNLFFKLTGLLNSVAELVLCFALVHTEPSAEEWKHRSTLNY